MASLVGQAPNEEVLASAAARAGRDAEPFFIDNVRADLEWRRQMAPVLIKRALVSAVARTKGEQS